jgi:hypothetical protein
VCLALPGLIPGGDLAEPKIHGIQPIAIERTGLNDVQELDGVSASERPPEIRCVDDAGDVELPWYRCAASRMLALLSDDLLNNMGSSSAPAPVVSIPLASSQPQPCWPEWR